MLKNIDTNRECITTPEAAKRSGLSMAHLTRLLKSGAVEGVQLGREWIIYADSLAEYVAAPHKPGPKGPIKKKQQNVEQNSDEMNNS